MADTTCPSCDAPAPARARACSSCGYRFYEDGGAAEHLPRPDRTTLTLGAAVTVLTIAAIAAAVLLAGGDSGHGTASGATASSRLTVLSAHPLPRRPLERLLEDRYLPVQDDDEANVTCSGRIPKPAHSVRRCRVHYPGGTERRIVVLTKSAGAEVLSEP